MKFLLTFILLASLQTSENCGSKNMREAANKNSNAVSSTTPTPKSKDAAKFDRLPAGIEPTTEVEGKAVKNQKGETESYEIVTAEKRLSELGARYADDDKLVDAAGREIRFFQPICRGVSPGFEEDRRERREKDAELADLKKKFTVVVVHCDLRKMM